MELQWEKKLRTHSKKPASTENQKTMMSLVVTYVYSKQIIWIKSAFDNHICKHQVIWIIKKNTTQTPIDENLPFITMATNFFIHRLMPFVLSSFFFLDTNAFFCCCCSNTLNLPLVGILVWWSRISYAKTNTFQFSDKVNRYIYSKLLFTKTKLYPRVIRFTLW